MIDTPDLRVLSLGAGVQSTVMALMAAKKEIGPMPDVCIFADTQWEPKGVYEHLDWLEAEIKRLTNGKMKTCRVSVGNIRDDHVAGKNTTGQNFSSMPLFGGSGMGRRQCTHEYKIQPIRQKVRSLLGLKKGDRVKSSVETWIGISTDESLRMKPSRDKWNTNRWPLVEEEMARHHCLTWFGKNYPGKVLAKSACIGCPFHNDAMWREMKLNDPVSFADAVDFDKSIRTTGATYKTDGTEQFLHKDKVPLDEADLRNAEDLGQIDMFNNECEGMCGV